MSCERLFMTLRVGADALRTGMRWVMCHELLSSTAGGTAATDGRVRARRAPLVVERLIARFLD